MGDLTPYLPQHSPTVAAIYSHYKRAGDAEPVRGYLGASIIGHECERFLWYCFRQCCKSSFDGRMYRLFETGDLAEARFVENLRAIGCEVHDRDPNTGGQFAVEALGGHFSGHMDGCALGVPEAPKTWHVTEFKTHNAKSFAKLQKEGVKKTKPQHYAQMMVYMHLTGMTRALYLAVNKDTDELYSERVRYDKAEAEQLMARAERVIRATAPPERIASRPDYFVCNYCDAHDICWGTAAPAPALPLPSISCRQCCHATPTMDGHARWVCEKHGRALSEGDQARACAEHLILPGLLTFAEPVDYGQHCGGECITFKGPGEATWLHGPGHGAYGTRELMSLPASLLDNGVIGAAKEAFGATVTGFCPDDILHRYPEADCRIVWKGRAGRLVEAWKELYGEDLASLTPITKCDATEYRAAEYDRGRVAVFCPITKEAEIREGIE